MALSQDGQNREKQAETEDLELNRETVYTVKTKRTRALGTRNYRTDNQ